VGKNAKKKPRRQERPEANQRTLRLAAVIERNLMRFVVQEGMKALDLLLEGERQELCGPRNGKREPGAPVRWGNTRGRLVMGGQRVMARKPRVRQDGSEVELPAWSEFAHEDPLSERTVEQMLVGVSTRRYARSLEDLPEELESHGTSKSAASRRFVAKTQEQLDVWLRRDLSEMSLCVVMLDGIELGEHTVVAALGIDESGSKQPLGVWLGATENAQVCGALLDNLIERGLDPLKPYLFVIDGSKALRKAIRDRFGTRGIVQRCQVHKARNVRSHLPKSKHAGVSKAMREAYRSRSRKTAQKQLERLARSLDREHPDAAASLREGLSETLTLKGLGLGDTLERTLSTTNPIENMNSTIRRVSKRVKTWRDGRMVKRWVASAIIEAERGFRRLRGFRGISALVAHLRGHAERIDRVDEASIAA
jgi:transposase-like protein